MSELGAIVFSREIREKIMGHGTHYAEVEAQGIGNLGDVLNRSLGRFGEEQSYDANPCSNSPYLLTSEIVTKEKAYRLVEKLVIRDDSPTPIVRYTDDYTETKKKVIKSVSREVYERMRRNHRESNPVNYCNLFEDTVYKATVVSFPKVKAPKASNTEGKMVVKYVLVSKGSTLEEKYDSIAEARTEALRILNLPKNERFSRFTVEAVAVREDGNSVMAVIERPIPDEVKVTFEVTYRIPKKNAKVHGYVLAYDFHH